MAAQRDPVSVLLDRGAASLLNRAYDRPGQWVHTRLESPTLRHQLWARRQGIEPYERDRWGLQRWPRGLKRSMYYLHKWHYWPGQGINRARRRTTETRGLALVVEIGNRNFYGADLAWPVRARVVPGGAAAKAAARRRGAYTERADLRSEVQERDY